MRPIFDTAMRHGLNLWDTAYAYGMGISEKMLGGFLKDLPRMDYFISDKFTPQCALSGKYDTKHPMPAGSARAAAYNPVLNKLEQLNAGLRKVADKYQVDIAQIPVAWAIGKNTLPIIGVPKTRHVADAVKAAEITLTTEEIKELEALADSLDINVIRMWEKEMK